MRNVVISIASIVGSGFCVAAVDGQRVYAAINKCVADKDRVIISFSGVTRMTTAFLNAAVGQLYGEFSESEIRKYLAPPIDFEDWHLRRLKIVVDRAKQYFSDETKFEEVIRDTLKEGDDIDI